MFWLTDAQTRAGMDARTKPLRALGAALAADRNAAAWQAEIAYASATWLDGPEEQTK